VTGGLLNTLGPIVVVFAIVAIQFAGAGRRRARALAAERRAAGGSLTAARATPPERVAAAPAPPPPAVRPAMAAARLPKRVEPAAAPVAPAAKRSFRAGGPRWAANAFVAAEVFGPPLAARPGGTLGPPSAL